MSSGSVPLPHDSDLQTETTQGFVSKAKAAQELISEVIKVGHDLSKNHANKPPKVKVEISKGTTHQALWEKYSQGVQSERPVARSLTVAKTALNAGQSPDEVQQILHHDPQFTKIQQQKGNAKAQEYTKVVTRSAAYPKQQGQSNQQLQKQQHKTHTQPRQMGIST